MRFSAILLSLMAVIWLVLYLYLAGIVPVSGFVTANRSEFYGPYCASRAGCISACNNCVSGARDDIFYACQKTGQHR